MNSKYSSNLKNFVPIRTSDSFSHSSQLHWYGFSIFSGGFLNCYGLWIGVHLAAKQRTTESQRINPIFYFLTFIMQIFWNTISPGLVVKILWLLVAFLLILTNLAIELKLSEILEFSEMLNSDKQIKLFVVWVKATQEIFSKYLWTVFNKFMSISSSCQPILHSWK